MAYRGVKVQLHLFLTWKLWMRKFYLERKYQHVVSWKEPRLWETCTYYVPWKRNNRHKLNIVLTLARLSWTKNDVNIRLQAHPTCWTYCIDCYRMGRNHKLSLSATCSSPQHLTERRGQLHAPYLTYNDSVRTSQGTAWLPLYRLIC
jgi:hypothetical protein